MNREDIIRMAREAGIEWQSNKGITGRVRVTTCGSQPVEKIERLVKAAYAAGAAAEREACAKIIESDPSYDWHKFACEAANAIRARGQA